MGYLTEDEEKLYNLMKKASSYVPSGYHFEIALLEPSIGEYTSDLHPSSDIHLDGYYAMKYKEGYGAENLTEFSEYSNKPLISEDEAEEKGIDVYKVVKYFGCYWSCILW